MLVWKMLMLSEPSYRIHKLDDNQWLVEYSVDNQVIDSVVVKGQQDIGAACFRFAEQYGTVHTGGVSNT